VLTISEKRNIRSISDAVAARLAVASPVAAVAAAIGPRTSGAVPWALGARKKNSLLCRSIFIRMMREHHRNKKANTQKGVSLVIFL
jgi:hypothetical protein